MNVWLETYAVVKDMRWSTGAQESHGKAKPAKVKEIIVRICNNKSDMLKCFRKLEVTQSSSTQVSKTHSQCDVIDIHMKVLGALLWTTPGTALVFKTLTRYLRNPVLATRQNRWNMDESFTEVGDRHVTPTQNGAHRWQNFSNEISFTKTLQNTDVRDMFTNIKRKWCCLGELENFRLVLSNILFNILII